MRKYGNLLNLFEPYYQILSKNLKCIGKSSHDAKALGWVIYIP